VFLVILLLAFNVWTIYNIPVLIVGVRHLLQTRKKRSESLVVFKGETPIVSIIVPVKNEEKVIGRLLKALVNLNYPSGKKEIIVVNDGSSDNTGRICERYASCYPDIRVFNRTGSSTKAAALNFGLRYAKGEIIATFDADSVPESDALLRAVEYFSDAKVAALQGRICSINAEENMLTKFLFYEGAVQYEVFLRGKDRLNLYVGLAGTCQFIRRDMLEELGGWNSKSLSEDYELSLRLTEKDYLIKYASDVRTWEESPATFRDLVRQRARWYRGNIELSFKFGKLIKKFSWRRFDAEMTLLGTYVIALCVLNYFMAAWVLFVPPNLFLILNLIARFTSLFVLATLFFVGIGLAFLTRPFGFSNLLWLPFMYFYWGFQSFIAVYAFLQIVLRRPMKWSRAERSGVVTAEVAKKILETAQRT